MTRIGKESGVPQFLCPWFSIREIREIRGQEHFGGKDESGSPLTVPGNLGGVWNAEGD